MKRQEEENLRDKLKSLVLRQKLELRKLRKETEDKIRALEQSAKEIDIIIDTCICEAEINGEEK